jgi:carbonic anhydrase
MKTLSRLLLFIFTGLFAASCGKNKTNSETESHPSIANAHIVINTPEEALAEMKAGNQRFLDGKPLNTDFKSEIEETKTSQHPHSVVLSCMDSRVPPEIIFDQGIGHIFVARVAGNVEDANELGSLEYATKVKGCKLLIVMGHSNCGAVHGAVEKVELGNLTQLVHQIDPAITGDTTNLESMIDETAKKNVRLTVDDILRESPVINDLVKEGKLKVIGAFYDVATGKIAFSE